MRNFAPYTRYAKIEVVHGTNKSRWTYSQYFKTKWVWSLPKSKNKNKTKDAEISYPTPGLRAVALVARCPPLGRWSRLLPCCCCTPSFGCSVMAVFDEGFAKMISLGTRLCADFCPNAEMRQIGFNVPDPLFLVVYLLLFWVVMTTPLWCFWLDSTSSMNIFITQ